MQIMDDTKRPAAQQRYIDDELLRAPMLAGQVVDATIESLRTGSTILNPQERMLSAELVQHLMPLRSRLVDRFADSVRAQVEPGQEVRPKSGAAALVPPPLALLDEAEVAADVEVSRAIEAIKSVAEHELRELATFTSALAGDMDLRSDHNPFSPEAYAKALWDTSHDLPMARGYQMLFMRSAITPLAQLLRKAYAGSCARLESAGLEPAVYRTVILPAGARSMRPGDSWLGRGPDLNQLREAMPAPMDGASEARSTQMPLDHVIGDADRALRALPEDAPLAERSQLLSAQRSRIVRHADKVVDRQLIELLTRLFDAILMDSRISRDVQIALSRLQPALMRLALRDPALLDDYAHPAWRFMDHVAHQVSLLAPGSQSRATALLQVGQLVDDLAREDAPDARRYRKAVDELQAGARRRLETRVQRAGPDLATLQSLELRLAERDGPLPTGAGPLDETQLDTVPADLMDDLRVPKAGAPDATAWLNDRRPGDWIRLFQQGQWTRAQLLWQGPLGDAWLFGQGSGETTCALRRRALERLYNEGLASLILPRSLAKSAAVHLTRSASGPSGR